jgi:hypothetical protein
LREAAITSLPGDSGQSFNGAVVDGIIDGPAWESRLISSSTNSNTHRQKWQRSEPEMSCANWSNSNGGLIILLKTRM